MSILAALPVIFLEIWAFKLKFHPRVDAKVNEVDASKRICTIDLFKLFFERFYFVFCLLVRCDQYFLFILRDIVINWCTGCGILIWIDGLGTCWFWEARTSWEGMIGEEPKSCMTSGGTSLSSFLIIILIRCVKFLNSLLTLLDLAIWQGLLCFLFFHFGDWYGKNWASNGECWLGCYDRFLLWKDH